MIDQRLALFEALGNSLLNTPGDTSTALRATLRQCTTSLCNTGSLELDDLPQELTTYVRKAALYAYRITDQDVEALRAQGYSEDALFEITLNVAFGAGMNCLTSGLAALKGANDALKAD